MQLALSKDKHGVPIQALALDEVSTVSIGGTSQRVTLPDTTELLRVVAPVNCYINFGDSSVDASTTTPAMLAGVEIFRVPEGVTHIAVINMDGSNGILSVTKMV